MEGLELFFSLLSVCLRSEGGRGYGGHCLSDLVEGGCMCMCKVRSRQLVVAVWGFMFHIRYERMFAP